MGRVVAARQSRRAMSGRTDTHVLSLSFCISKPELFLTDHTFFNSLFVSCHFLIENLFLIYPCIQFTLISRENIGRRVDTEFLYTAETYEKIFDNFLILRSSFSTPLEEIFFLFF
jgi:hypothetical protein